MTDTQKELLLETGWKESQAIPGYWADPMSGTLLHWLNALRTMGDRHEVNANSPERHKAHHALHLESKSYRARKSRKIGVDEEDLC